MKVLGNMSGSGEQAFARQQQYQYQHEDRVVNGERQAGIDEIRAEALGHAEEQPGNEAAHHVADAAHDHDYQRLQRVADADGRIET